MRKLKLMNYQLLLSGLFLLLATSCDKEDQSIISPIVESVEVFDIANDSFKFKGRVIDEGSGYISAGAIASTNQHNWQGDDFIADLQLKHQGEGEYIADFSQHGIQSGTRYYVRAYVTYYTHNMILTTETRYGSILTFTTN